jgi:LemA protein
MKKSLLVLIGAFVFLGLIVLIGFLTSISTYNNMVKYEEEVTKSWALVETDYQRRADLIPNLVNTVKGYADFEKSTLTAVIEARAKATSVNISADNLNEQTMAQFQQAQNGLSSALSKLLVVVEKYPELKANQNFLELQAQLEGTENRIANARMKFNESTRTYNVYIRRFPARFFASIYGFEQKPYFTAVEGTEKAPEVKF